MPPEPLAQEQVIEEKLVACGLNSAGFTVTYQDELQSIEVVISDAAGSSLEMIDCIREAVRPEIVTFENGEMQLAYDERSTELARPQMLADARRSLEERGLPDGFPERADFSSDKLFAEAIEKHCGVESGSFFVESDWGLVAQPKVTGKSLSGPEWEQVTCLMSAMMYVAAKGEAFKIGFIGNEKFRESEGQ